MTICFHQNPGCRVCRWTKMDLCTSNTKGCIWSVARVCRFWRTLCVHSDDNGLCGWCVLINVTGLRDKSLCTRLRIDWAINYAPTRTFQDFDRKFTEYRNVFRRIFTELIFENRLHTIHQQSKIEHYTHTTNKTHNMSGQGVAYKWLRSSSR